MRIAVPAWRLSRAEIQRVLTALFQRAGDGIGFPPLSRAANGFISVPLKILATGISTLTPVV
jgi:hypothetical protein